MIIGTPATPTTEESSATVVASATAATPAVVAAAPAATPAVVAATPAAAPASLWSRRPSLQATTDFATKWTGLDLVGKAIDKAAELPLSKKDEKGNYTRTVGSVYKAAGEVRVLGRLLPKTKIGAFKAAVTAPVVVFGLPVIAPGILIPASYALSIPTVTGTAVAAGMALNGTPATPAAATPAAATSTAVAAPAATPAAVVAAPAATPAAVVAAPAATPAVVAAPAATPAGVVDTPVLAAPSAIDVLNQRFEAVAAQLAVLEAAKAKAEQAAAAAIDAAKRQAQAVIDAAAPQAALEAAALAEVAANAAKADAATQAYAAAVAAGVAEVIENERKRKAAEVVAPKDNQGDAVMVPAADDAKRARTSRWDVRPA
jgi:2-oxoglutarate dehydrogenase E2 component (dihydrolipoamide succinyltransferase)